MRFSSMFAVSLLSLASLQAFAADAKKDGKKADKKGACFTLELDANDAMQFQIKGAPAKEVKVPKACAGKEIALKLHHIGKLPANAMPHNIIVAAADKQPAQLSTRYAPAAFDVAKIDATSAELLASKDILAYTNSIGGGQTSNDASIPAGATKSGDKLPFFCGVLGHSALMNGTLIFE